MAAVVVAAPFVVDVEEDGILFKSKLTNRRWQIGKLGSGWLFHGGLKNLLVLLKYQSELWKISEWSISTDYLLMG